MGAPSLPLHRDDQAEAAYLARLPGRPPPPPPPPPPRPRDARAEAASLARLGERVRAWRAEHAMTRKTLALASGVSERYLAQLEAGKGNISVLLLRKVARAMGVAVESLVREEGTREKCIALIG